MRFLRKSLKYFLYLLSLIILFEIVVYSIVPVYDFPLPEPFKGSKLYNPYAGMDSIHWRKINFHFHTRAWGGITSGRQNTDQLFWETYKKLRYDAPMISNYQQISTFHSDSAYYIPTYEHGFGVRKKHQICIGAKKVLWFDLSLYQNRHHKQFILNLLRNENEIVAIAHPGWDDGYPPEQLKYLTNYDLLEVLDNNYRSVELWDTALSAGHPVFILADDDAHNIFDPYEIGRCCNFINSPSNSSHDLIRSLKSGNAYGADIFMHNNETIEDKAKNTAKIPILTSFQVRHDTIWLSLTKKAMNIRFIGQGGKIKEHLWYTEKGFYKFKPDDTYIRTEIILFNDRYIAGTRLYLNPVFRYEGNRPVNSLTAKINWVQTWIFRIVSACSLIIIIFLAIYFRKKNFLSKKNK